MLRKTVATILFALPIAVSVAQPSAAAPDAGLKHYDSSGKGFWKNPPPDWFLGDENPTQKGLTLPQAPALPASAEDLQKNLEKIKLPQGFKISLYAANVPQARQMAWGDDQKSILFVGSWQTGEVYAVTDGGKSVKTVIKGLRMPTGLAVHDGALFVVDIDKIYKYSDAAKNVADLGKGEVVYDDMPPFLVHGWKYLTFDNNGFVYVAFGPPFNIGNPPSSVAQIRRINLKTGSAEIVALGVRNSVGGAIDPRTGHYWFTENARDWLSDDTPSDKLNIVDKVVAHYGYPYCHAGDLPDPKFAQGHTCSEFKPPVLKLGAHVAPLGMKFYTGGQFPAEYKDNIFIAEHGSWNRHKYLGGSVVRVIADPDGNNAREEPFASGWITGPQEYIGRPVDVIVAGDGSLLVSDDWSGAIYKISYAK